MEQTVLVIRIPQAGVAEVIRRQEGGCSGDCTQCGACHSAHKPDTILVEDPIGVKVGAWVTIEPKTSAVVKAAALLYILPAMLLVAGFLVGEHLWQKGILFSLLGLTAGMLLVKLADRAITKRGNAYTITGYGEAPKA